MPVITYEGATLSLAQKEQLIQHLTDAAARIMGIDTKFYYVYLKELSPNVLIASTSFLDTIHHTVTYESTAYTGNQKYELVKAFKTVLSKVLVADSKSVSVYLRENSLDNVGVGGITLRKFQEIHSK
ncbi:MAG: hypothetical protein LBK70_03810 [Clostridiales bacterium]|jgi:phenylpyruvate tautomerase PptA (4-oxalocrotonate tautomerase family)|nr:hypothetical protein [Clostridiales bacterium]